MSGYRLYLGSNAGSNLREWSSLIGIVTAIIGNILISFALNIQRYAHIRLAREQEEQKRPWDTRHMNNGHKSYGTQQSDIAEDRIKANLNAPLQGEQPTNSQSPRKEYTQVPGTHSASMHSRSSSESTIKQFEKPKPQPERKTYLKSPYWWTGIILMIAGEAGNFIAYGFAPASIVSPLGVVALVSNCIIAPCLLHERFRQRDFWGVVVAVGGAVTIVLSAKNSETKMGPNDVWAAITRWEFETYLGITAALIVVLIWASGRYGERTIMIDLGLVALCGEYEPKVYLWSSVNKQHRRLHCLVYERRRISTVRYSLACPDLPYNLSPCVYTGRVRSSPDTICQSCSAEVRFYPGHPCTVRPLHNFRDNRERCAIPRLPIS